MYVSLFPDSQIDGVAPGPDGSPMMVSFTLMGRPYQALNGGPHFRFNEAVSLAIPCEDQAEVDHYWAALTEILGDPDPERSGRAMQAMLQMRKLDVAAMRAAADQIQS